MTDVSVLSVALLWAILLSTGAGLCAWAQQSDVAAMGKTTAGANRELFILDMGGDGESRFARYSFSMNPPRHG